jgi:predicted transcriptional regulator
VNKIYAPYINKHEKEFSKDLTHLNSDELAKRKIVQFLEVNKSLDNFNKSQRIILIASDFDVQTLSAVAWLSENGVQIECYKLIPYVFNESFIINAEKYYRQLKIKHIL